MPQRRLKPDSTMQGYVLELQRHVHAQLESAAFGYLDLGLGVYERHSELYPPYAQLVIGNLGIAIELMLKSLVALQSLSLVFRHLPAELRALFACPDMLPEAPRWRVFDVEIRSGKPETIEFNEAVGQFKLLYPTFYAELSSHLKFISDNRNAAIWGNLGAIWGHHTGNLQSGDTILI
jgi:hypothetical protein